MVPAVRPLSPTDSPFGLALRCAYGVRKPSRSSGRMSSRSLAKMISPNTRYAMPTAMSSIPPAESGTSAPMMNCAQNRPNSSRASRSEMDRVASTARAKNDCAAVRKSSSRWCASIGRPEIPPEAIANTIGSVPTRSVHWFTFEDTSVPRPALVFSRQA
jgi:hypothetical protein